MNSIIDKKDDFIDTESELKSVTIFLSGTDRKLINAFSKEFYQFVLGFDKLALEPTIIPTEKAVFTTRKSPCGNGTASFSRHTLKVHQRVFNLSVYVKDLARISEFLKSSNIDASLTMNQ